MENKTYNTYTDVVPEVVQCQAVSSAAHTPLSDHSTIIGTLTCLLHTATLITVIMKVALQIIYREKLTESWAERRSTDGSMDLFIHSEVTDHHSVRGYHCYKLLCGGGLGLGRWSTSHYLPRSPPASCLTYTFSSQSQSAEAKLLYFSGYQLGFLKLTLQTRNANTLASWLLININQVTTAPVNQQREPKDSSCVCFLYIFQSSLIR